MTSLTATLRSARVGMCRRRRLRRRSRIMIGAVAAPHLLGLIPGAAVVR